MPNKEPLPVSEDMLVDLFNFLTRKLCPESGSCACDHTHRYTREFISAHKLDADTIIPWLEAQGGACDCGTLVNVFAVWDGSADGPEDEDEDEDTPEDDEPFLRSIEAQLAGSESKPVGEITLIDCDDRLAERVKQRSAAEAVEEMRLCLADFNQTLERLAEKYPGCIAIAGICGGRSCGALVCGPSAKTNFYSPMAPNRMRTLGHLVANLPPELRESFQIALNFVLKRKELLREMDEAVKKALREAAEAKEA